MGDDNLNVWTRPVTIPWVRIQIVPAALVVDVMTSFCKGIGFAGAAVVALAAAGLAR